MSDLPKKPESTSSFGVHVAKSVTPARLGIGRTGGSLTTRELLDFDLAHARARDAVHQMWNPAHFESEIKSSADPQLQNWPVVRLKSAAADRATYLKRPDFGRRLAGESIRTLESLTKGADLAVILSDGLSAQAASNQALPVLARLIPTILERNWSLAPLLAIPFARVGISDHVGSILQCRAIVILLGERPGLATPESLGAYVTYEPRAGRTDADRNCISNIHTDGLRPAEAAESILALLDSAFRYHTGGVSLSMLIAEAAQQGRQAAIEKPTDS
jgi:ethanolamine ammonia-lyase small subunit